jgi:Na+/H+ antiporter NhaC
MEFRVDLTKRRSFPILPIIVGAFILVFLCGICLHANAFAGQQSASIDAPGVVLANVPFRIQTTQAASEKTVYKVLITQNNRVAFSYEGAAEQGWIEAKVPASGIFRVVITAGGSKWVSKGRALPGLASIFPPVLAILAALIFRQVIVALFAGVWLGAFLVRDFNIIRSFYYVLDHYIIDSLAGTSGVDHISIAIFTLLLGGMVGVISRMGGTQGIVDRISHIAVSPRRGQIATWLMGIFIFFDDYTNTLIVGNTMRPLTDRLRISREKLSYIVDATAAPVTCIAVISSWIGFEISLIKDAFIALGLERNPFTTFVSSIKFSFYPILTLIFGLLIAGSQRDFGPMLTAERRARETGKVLSDKAVPISNIDTELAVADDIPRRWINAVLPIAVVVLGTVLGLVVTGRNSLLAAGSGGYTLMDIFRESNSFTALLWSSITGCVVAILMAISQRLLSLTQTLNAWIAGIKSMVPAIIILVLAWCIGAVCYDLHTADFLIAKMSGVISPNLLPSLIFLVAAAISFSTGTSWGTMTILTPITIPLAFKILEVSSLSAGNQNVIMLSSIAAILAGSVFGDHCSPISDTTIMSSMASAADHVDHVRTQLPYAFTVAVISLVLGYLPTAYGLPTVFSFVLGIAAIFAVIMLLGKKDMSYEHLEM